MCKVVKYWFACHHGFPIRHSSCGGTRHKDTRSGLTAACKSEAYMSLVFAANCGPCQRQAFEDGWKQKLASADMFLGKLKEKGFPGVQEVNALIAQLTDDFNTATWGTRALFPHAHKERVVRVSLGRFEKAPSPLRNEILPSDIAVPPEVIGHEHPDYKYDWDYVASTDPIHPVDTKYAHPLDDVDPSWMLNHLSPEEFEQCGEGVGFDATEADMTWAGSLAKLNIETINQTDDTVCWTVEATGHHSTDMNSSQAPERTVRAASTMSEVETCTQDKRLLAERVNIIVQEFWRLVNSDISPQYSFQDVALTLNENTNDGSKRLYMSDPSSDSETLQAGLLTPPRTHPRNLSDGSCDLDFLTLSLPNDVALPPFLEVGTQSQSPSSSRSATRSAPNSTRSFCDRWRQHISPIRDVDRVKFNRELLLLSRCEIKHIDGSNGRFVLDPQLSRDDNINNGWWK